MTERDAFELRLGTAVHDYIGRVSSELDPVELAHRIATSEPRHQGLVAALAWRAVAVPQVAWVVLLLGALLAAMVAGMLVGGSQRPTWAPRADVPMPVAPVAWPTWSPASAVDTALVDRLNEFWRAHDVTDVAALEALWAEDLVFTVEGEVYGGRDGMRDSLPAVRGTFSRVGDVTVTTDPVPGLWSLPEGSRFLAFVESTTGELRDLVLEVDGEDRIVVFYNDAHVPPAERARDGYTRVDFTMTAGPGASASGQEALANARLTLVVADRVRAGDLPGCEDPAGSSLVFLYLRLEDVQLELRDIASDTVEVRGPGGEKLGPASCHREPAFEPAAGVRDGWVGVTVPADSIGRLSLVYRHIDQGQGDQQPEVHEALIPFDLPPA